MPTTKSFFSSNWGGEQSHWSYIEDIQGTQQVQRLWVIFGLRSILFLVELGVGLGSHSISLLAGSGHLFLDLMTIGLTLLATWLLQCQSYYRANFKYQRLGAKVALVNGVSLIAIALLIATEAVEHLIVPEPVLGLPMLILAFLSLVINGLITYLLHSDSSHNLNLRGVFLHGVADALSSIGLVLAAVAVYYFNWLWADAATSLFVACLIGLSAILLVRDSLRILAE